MGAKNQEKYFRCRPDIWAAFSAAHAELGDEVKLNEAHMAGMLLWLNLHPLERMDAISDVRNYGLRAQRERFEADQDDTAAEAAAVKSKRKRPPKRGPS